MLKNTVIPKVFTRSQSEGNYCSSVPEWGWLCILRRWRHARHMLRATEQTSRHVHLQPRGSTTPRVSLGESTAATNRHLPAGQRRDWDENTRGSTAVLHTPFLARKKSLVTIPSPSRVVSHFHLCDHVQKPYMPCNARSPCLSSSFSRRRAAISFAWSSERSLTFKKNVNNTKSPRSSSYSFDRAKMGSVYLAKFLGH